MAKNSFEFKAFGIKDNLQSLIKRTGILEIIFGSYFIFHAVLYFFVFVSYLFYGSWGESVFKFFGYNEEVGLGAVFVLLFVLMGALQLIIASLMFVSGLKAKAYSKNPVLLINGKKDYLASAVCYIIFMALLLITIYVCLKFTFSLFLYFIIIALLALLTVILYKFLALQNLPDKEGVLDVETLPDEKKEAILKKSSTLEVEKNRGNEQQKIPQEKKDTEKTKATKTTKQNASKQKTQKVTADKKSGSKKTSK